MKKLILLFSVFCILCPVYADTHTSIVANGDWNDVSTWDVNAVPVDGDAFNIAVGHTITLDVDQSGMPNGMAASVLNGTLKYITDGTYCYLKIKGNLTGTGSLYIGEEGDPIPAPAGSTPEVATFAFNGAYGVTGILANCEMWGELRVPFFSVASKTNNTTIVLANGSTAGWLRAGDVIAISDSTIKANHSPATETFTVASYSHDGTKGTITLNAGTPLTRSVNQNSCVDAVVLISHNIKVMNTSSKVPFFYTKNTAGKANGVQFNYLTAVISSGVQNWQFNYCSCYNVTYGFTSAGSTGCSGTSVNYCAAVTGSLLSGAVVNSSVSYSIGINGGPLLNGVSNCIANNCEAHNNNQAGFMSVGGECIITDSLSYNCSNAGMQYGGANHIYTRCKSYYNNGGGFAYFSQNCTFIDCESYGSASASLVGINPYTKLINCVFGDSVESTGHNTTGLAQHTLIESINHNDIANAYKDWGRGGIVTSQTASPPSGYTTWYAHACESATYPCFRQWQVTVDPNETLVVTGKMRIPNNNDLSANPPAFEIVDFFNDYLIDNTASPLARMYIPISDGSNNGWQDMSIAKQNTEASPQLWIIRTTATHATQQVDECVYVPDMPAQVAAIYTKLPTNYIMGSSVQTAKDDEIDDILVDTSTTIPNTLSAILEDTGTTIPGLVNDVNNYLTSVLSVTSVAIAAIFEDTNSTIPGLIAALVVPDPAGTAAALHVITDGLITALNDFDPDTDIVEGTYTYKDYMRLISSLLFGKMTRPNSSTANFYSPVNNSKLRFQETGNSAGRTPAVIDAND